MNKFTVQPLFHPTGSFIFSIYYTFFFLQKGVIHFTFCGLNQHAISYGKRISAVVAVFTGIVIVKLVIVLSEPKSNTATDALLRVTL